MESLELKGEWPSPLSRLESDLFSDFLKENMSLRSFKCVSDLLTSSMMESLMSSQRIDEKIYSNSYSENLNVQERRPQACRQSTYTIRQEFSGFIHVDFKRKFSQDVSVSGILRAKNLTTLHLPSCMMSKSESNVLCKLLSTH